MLPDSVLSINGFLSAAESQLLFDLAVQVPLHGIIVEIGSFQGKSTVCLGQGAKQSGAHVYAIDPHIDFQESETTHYGMENHVELLKNLVQFDVADVVRLIGLPSGEAVCSWSWPIDVLWIDGSHDYHDVCADLNWWQPFVSVQGRIALHDSSGHYPDVTRALDEFLMDGSWTIAQRIDATTVLERNR